MEIIKLNEARKKHYHGLSVALGAFDGLHIGHMALIDAARQAPGQSAVLTFDTLPGELFCSERPQHLMTTEEKTCAFAAAGIDIFCVAHFDKKFASIESEEFERILAEAFSPRLVVAGYNYTYGCHACGNAQTLMDAGRKLGFEVCIIPPVIAHGEAVSSSRIRRCLEAGDVVLAEELLGRPYSVCGKVGRGRGIGSTQLGFPTANIRVSREKLIPSSGVYSVEIDAVGGNYKGVCNIGINPTVSESGSRSIEIHILALSADLYRRKITVRFKKRLRDEKKFSNLDELKQQIQRDIDSI